MVRTALRFCCTTWAMTLIAMSPRSKIITGCITMFLGIYFLSFRLVPTRAQEHLRLIEANRPSPQKR
jgi:hypothetical protein